MPPVVSSKEWQEQRDALLVSEKEATRLLDSIAARRRRLPMVRFDNARYVFQTSEGPRNLSDLFGANRQLAIYQFMDRGPGRFCPGCTHFTRNVADLPTLAEAGVSWWTASDMPLEQMESYWDEQGFGVPFASSRGTPFSTDCGAGAGFMLSLFFTDGADVYRTYSTTARGVDRVLFVNNILDLAAYGRQEDWEDSPQGWPQGPTYG